MDPMNYRAKAIALLKEQKFKAAGELLSKAIAAYPDSAELISERGVLHLHLGNKREALQDMDKAVELQPQNSYRYSSRAFTRDRFGDTEGAIADYQIAVNLDPEDDIAHNNLGLLQEKLGYIDKAKRNFEKADRLNQERTGKTEVGGRHNHELEAEKIAPRNIQREIEAERKLQKTFTEQFFSVFTDKKERQSFFQFIRSGFKVK
jgi:tetratricopeptide (TPR) repeat protein